MEHPLYVYPEIHKYTNEEEDDFLEKLADVARHTRLDHVTLAKQLQIDEQGRTADGYRLTSTAFKQVCSVAGKGLDRLVTDLCGVFRSPEDPRSDYSVAEAVRIYNLTLALRFANRFVGNIQVIRNTRDSRIEGLVGRKYNYLANRAVYDMAHEAVSGAYRPVRFYEANLWGRRLSMRFIHQDPLFDIPATAPGVDRERFHGGYGFSNSEVGGEASVRASMLICRERDGATAVGTGFSGRVVHTGSPKRFLQKLNKMFASVMAADQDADELKRRMLGLRNVPLKLGGPEAEHEHQVDYLSLFLHRFDIPKALARRIVLATIQSGSEPLMTYRTPDRRTMAARTAFDLYSVIAREARGFAMPIRETAEQAAYSLLMGKVKLH